MSIIQADSLTKNYSVYHKQPGLKGSLKGIFKREYILLLALLEYLVLIPGRETISSLSRLVL